MSTKRQSTPGSFPLSVPRCLESDQHNPAITPIHSERASLPKWPDHLVIVRHAQSERNLWKEIATAKGDFIYGGEVRDMDVGLTEAGLRQAVATGKALGRQFRFDHVF